MGDEFRGDTTGATPANTQTSKRLAGSKRYVKVDEGSPRIGGKRSQLETTDGWKIQRRTRRLTLSLCCLVAALACLSPFVSIHLHQRLGLLLFESDLIQLRSSLYSVIICFLALMIFYSTVNLLNKRHSITTTSGTRILQRALRQLTGLSAIVSAISYLSIVLLVPQIKQIQRVPFATFDCNANLITIENCHQQFASKGGERTLFEAARELLAGNLNGNSEQLIKKLNCLKYNDKDLETLEVPTRFLLHKCGLVCKPQRQQLHQFNDDLNREQASQTNANHLRVMPAREEFLSTSSSHSISRLLPPQQIGTPTNISPATLSPSFGGIGGKQMQPQQTITTTKLVPPYADLLYTGVAHDKELSPIELGGTTATARHYVCHNGSSSIKPKDSSSHGSEVSATNEEANFNGEQGTLANTNQVSLKVCFSDGELSGGSNYKQFCITNLANNGGASSITNAHSQDQTLTVGQLNVMLRKQTHHLQQHQQDGLMSSSPRETEFFASDLSKSSERLRAPLIDQGTHYVNPVVQFESHFKNWPHLTRTNLANSGNTISIEDYRSVDYESVDEQANWCKFRPIPPFIVNNKPFSDIQCSLEHEYTMTTGPTLDSINFSGRGADKIYLRKSASSSPLKNGDGENFARERCNIQCKVNILYQVHMNLNRNSQKQSETRKHHNEDDENNSQDYHDTAGGKTTINDLHYYLPLKPCVIATGNKLKTLNYYLLFRTIGDSTLILSFVLLDVFLLLESIDRQQSQLEAEKYRLASLLLALTLVPLFVSLSFDLISSYMSPYYLSGRESRLATLISELPSNLWDYLVTLFSSASGPPKRQLKQTMTNLTATTMPNSTNNSSLDNAHEDRSAAFGTMGALQFIDNFMLPFFAYAVFMFGLAINSLAIPVVFAPSSPLIHSSSVEELGLMPQKTKQHQLRTNKGSCERKLPQSDNTSFAEKKSNRLISKHSVFDRIGCRDSRNRKQALRMTLFLMLALFMGIQFNLSHLTQTQILIESFGNPALPVAQTYPALKFILNTYLGAVIMVFLLAILVADEASTFFAEFSPFNQTKRHLLNKPTTVYNDGREKRNKAKLIWYLALSLIVYSIRYFVLANLRPEMRFKWLLVFLYQVVELFNFPLTWLALSTRAHEILIEYIQQHDKDNKETPSASNGQTDKSKQSLQKQQLTSDGTTTAKALNIHVIIQSSLALTYFVVARTIALFAHSLYISLHLHSDNVDWFITSFYRPIDETPTSTSTTTMADLNQRGNVTTTTTESDSGPAHAFSSSGGGGGNGSKAPDSLFSPLPSERQTYLHASRLFLKYNSLICLLFGTVLLLNLIYVKYQIWAEQRRTLDIFHPATPKAPKAALSTSRSTISATTDGQSEQIDDRLSLDLMRIHSPNTTRIIFPKSTVRLDSGKGGKLCGDEALGPRAKILFHYDLGNRVGDSSDDDGDKKEYEARDSGGAEERKRDEATRFVDFSRPTPPDLSPPVAPDEIKIPIEFEGGDNDEGKIARVGDRGVDFQGTDKHTGGRARRFESFERIVRHRNKRVRIFEDGETWPENEDAEIEIGKKTAETEVTAMAVAATEAEAPTAMKSRRTSCSQHKARAGATQSDDSPVTYAQSSKRSISSKANSRATKQTTSQLESKMLRTTTTSSVSGSQHRRTTTTGTEVSGAVDKGAADKGNRPKRSITFAPTTTLIGNIRPLQSAASTGQLKQRASLRGSSGSVAQRASPEPSIGNDDEANENNNNNNGNEAEDFSPVGCHHDADSIENGRTTASINHNDLN